MDSEAKKSIRAKRIQIAGLVDGYKRSLLAELYSFCEEKGGHFFDEWRDSTNSVMLNVDYDEENRMCYSCHKVESRKKL